MQNVKIPGVVWVIAIVAIVGLSHYYLEDPFIVDLIVIAGTMVLKSLNLGTSELNQALDIIDIFKRQPRVVVPATPPPLLTGEPQMRGPAPMLKTTDGTRVVMSEETTMIEDPPVLPATPPRPNSVAAWLVG